jgi:hypothetical protein
MKKKTIRQMMQVISQFIHLGDGCTCSLAKMDIFQEDGKIVAMFRNGADGGFVDWTIVITEFGKKFMCGRVIEPCEDYDMVGSVKGFKSFKAYEEGLIDLYGVSFEDINGDDQWEWVDIIFNFYDIMLESDKGFIEACGNPLDKMMGNHKRISEKLSADERWNK